MTHSMTLSWGETPAEEIEEGILTSSLNYAVSVFVSIGDTLTGGKPTTLSKVTWAQVKPLIYGTPVLDREALHQFLYEGTNGERPQSWFDDLTAEARADWYMWANEHWQLEQIERVAEYYQMGQASARELRTWALDYEPGLTRKEAKLRTWGELA